MIKETKIGEAIFVEQTTYYYYASEADRKNNKFTYSTSDRKVNNSYKRQARKVLKNKNNSLSNVAQ